MTKHHRHHHKQSSEETAADVGLPWTVAQPALVTYRSMGIGVFGATMRYVGMPLEKIALYMNSSQVSGKNQLAQATRLTFAEGALAPYRVVGPASLTAWFLQYSVMGVAFQFVDQTLATLLGVKPVYYGHELMEPPPSASPADVAEPWDYQAKTAIKTILSPVLAASMESFVSNRAEVQRYFGPQRFAEIEQALMRNRNNALVKAAGPAFAPNALRNVIMCQTSFLLTPITYKLYFPQEHKSKTTLFWYGLGLNVFTGNVLAITQQALWGRSLDYLAIHGRIDYTKVVQEGFRKEGLAAFFTGPKWFSRVLMNAPAQGTLPWFYNEVLPLAEASLLTAVKLALYDPFLAPASTDPYHLIDDEPRIVPHPVPVVTLQRQRSRMATLPTAHPDFVEEDFDLEEIVKHHHLHGEGQHPQHPHLPPHAHRHVTIQPRRTTVTALATSPPESQCHNSNNNMAGIMSSPSR